MRAIILLCFVLAVYCFSQIDAGFEGRDLNRRSDSSRFEKRGTVFKVNNKKGFRSDASSATGSAATSDEGTSPAALNESTEQNNAIETAEESTEAATDPVLGPIENILANGPLNPILGLADEALKIIAEALRIPVITVARILEAITFILKDLGINIISITVQNDGNICILIGPIVIISPTDPPTPPVDPPTIPPVDPTPAPPAHYPYPYPYPYPQAPSYPIYPVVQQIKPVYVPKPILITKPIYLSQPTNNKGNSYSYNQQQLDSISY